MTTLSAYEQDSLIYLLIKKNDELNDKKLMKDKLSSSKEDMITQLRIYETANLHQLKNENFSFYALFQEKTNETWFWWNEFKIPG